MSLDNYLYDLSNLFLIPVQFSVMILFIYAIFSLGMFVTAFVQRRSLSLSATSHIKESMFAKAKGYSLLRLFSKKPLITREDLEIAAHNELDFLRMTTRIAPMLGLVATMIPMGPALKSLANGNVQGISENLVIAFTAVIFSLLTASLTFWILSIKKQWLVNDIRFVEQWREENQTNVVKPLPATEGNTHAA